MSCDVSDPHGNACFVPKTPARGPVSVNRVREPGMGMIRRLRHQVTSRRIDVQIPRMLTPAPSSALCQIAKSKDRTGCRDRWEGPPTFQAIPQRRTGQQLHNRRRRQCPAGLDLPRLRICCERSLGAIALSVWISLKLRRCLIRRGYHLYHRRPIDPQSIGRLVAGTLSC
jgi:hypothetical protein